MPDRSNPCRQPDHEARLRQFMAGGKTIGKDNKKVKFIPDRNRGYETIDISDDPTSTTTTTDRESPPAKKPRAKESSKHFGVRFRPDLHKWVAEIRVYEWKSVDKKVWLGTFYSEVGAACAVDAARKLLKCQKKRPPNFPCPALSAYSQTIPAHLQLTNIEDDTMFKEVTVFVKRKAQEYAAAFCTGQGTTTAAVGLREQLVDPQYQVGDDDGNGCFQLPSDLKSHPLFAVAEDDDVFPTGSSYGTNTSFGSSYETPPLPSSCDGVDTWNSPTLPTSFTSYSSSGSGPSSCCASEGTSPEDSSWVHVQPPSMWAEEEALALQQGWIQLQEAPIRDYCLVDPVAMAMSVPMGMEDQTTIDDIEYLFDMEEDQASIDPLMDIFLGGEEVQMGPQDTYIDNQYGSWTFQQSFNSLSYNSLSNSFENREVC